MATLRSLLGLVLTLIGTTATRMRTEHWQRIAQMERRLEQLESKSGLLRTPTPASSVVPPQSADCAPGAVLWRG
ncbi:MAG: hypothetical protein GVY35_14410 [Bacteroidetes bacterium]|jgi:hypothetical protein|nr:hypothetical protein [Bacteroidota bacterium]